MHMPTTRLLTPSIFHCPEILGVVRFFAASLNISPHSQEALWICSEHCGGHHFCSLQAEDLSITGSDTQTQLAWKASRNTHVFMRLFYPAGAQTPGKTWMERNTCKQNFIVATANSSFKFQVLSSDFFFGILPQFLCKYPMSTAS